MTWMVRWAGGVPLFVTEATGDGRGGHPCRCPWHWISDDLGADPWQPW